MYSVSVTDRMMYAHTFTFGDGVPFTTGCTSVVTATFEGRELGPYDVLIDILEAQKLLRAVMMLYDHKNLDTLAEFQSGGGADGSAKRNTTVEVMAKAVFEKLMEALRRHHEENAATDGKGLGAITGMHIKLQETDVASASYGESNPSGIFTTPTIQGKL